MSHELFEYCLKPIDTQTKPLFKIAITCVVHAFKRNNAFIVARSQRISHRLELIGKVTLTHPDNRQRRSRCINNNVLDMYMPKIPVLDLSITIWKRTLVTPTVIGRIPKYLQSIFCIQLVNEFSGGVVEFTIVPLPVSTTSVIPANLANSTAGAIMGAMESQAP